ncbi:hypothetical protein Tco_0617154, partial [Tanacetum coccineum]
MRGRKAHLLEDKQIKSVGIFDECVETASQEGHDDVTHSSFEDLVDKAQSTETKKLVTEHNKGKNFSEVQPDTKLLVISTLGEFQALLEDSEEVLKEQENTTKYNFTQLESPKPEASTKLSPNTDQFKKPDASHKPFDYESSSSYSSSSSSSLALKDVDNNIHERHKESDASYDDLRTNVKGFVNESFYTQVQTKTAINNVMKFIEKKENENHSKRTVAKEHFTKVHESLKKEDSQLQSHLQQVTEVILVPDLPRLKQLKTLFSLTLSHSRLILLISRQSSLKCFKPSEDHYPIPFRMPTAAPTNVHVAVRGEAFIKTSCHSSHTNSDTHTNKKTSSKPIIEVTVLEVPITQSSTTTKVTDLIPDVMPSKVAIPVTKAGNLFFTTSKLEKGMGIAKETTYYPLKLVKASKKVRHDLDAPIKNVDLNKSNIMKVSTKVAEEVDVVIAGVAIPVTEASDLFFTTSKPEKGMGIAKETIDSPLKLVKASKKVHPDPDAPVLTAYELLDFIRHLEEHLKVHNEKLKKNVELKKKMYDRYNDIKKFEYHREFKFSNFSLSEWDELVIEEPEFDLLFLDEFGDEGFQRVNDIHKVKTVAAMKVITEESKALGLLMIDDDLFTYDTSCVKKQMDDLDNRSLDVYERKLCYDECEKIYVEVVFFDNKRLVRLIDVTMEEWLDLKYRDHTMASMEYDPSNVDFVEWLGLKFSNYMTIDWYTKNVLWIYWTRGDDEEVITDDELFNLGDGNLIEENEIDQIFRIDTDIFHFKKPLYAWIYKWNKDVPWVANMPWLDYGPWMEPSDDIEHICKSFRFKDGHAKWPTCNWKTEKYCNGGDLPRIIRNRDVIYFESYEWYENLKEVELKDEALNSKAIFEGLKGVDEESSDNAMTHCSPNEEWENFKRANHIGAYANSTYNPYLDVSRIFNDHAGINNHFETQKDEGWFDERELMGDDDDDIGDLEYYLIRKDPPYYVNEEEEKSKEKRGKLLRIPYMKPPTCKSEKFEVVKYSFRPSVEYVAIKEYEYDIKVSIRRILKYEYGVSTSCTDLVFVLDAFTTHILAHILNMEDHTEQISGDKYGAIGEVYVVPTGRVEVPAGRYVVPTGKDNVIVSAGRSKVIPAGRTILVL